MIGRLRFLLLISVLPGCGESPPLSEDAPGPAAAAPGDPVGGGVDAPTVLDRRTAEGGIPVGGEVPRPFTLTAELLGDLPSMGIQAVDHEGTSVQFRGTPVREVLARAGVEFGPALRGPRMASYLLVEAADGYRAVYALPELDEGFGHGAVYLVTEANGLPLGPDDGPFRIVAPGDARPARWVRQVTGLRVLSAGGDDGPG